MPKRIVECLAKQNIKALFGDFGSRKSLIC